MNVRFQEPISKTIAFSDGFDLESSHIEANPGSIVAGANLELVVGKKGFSRVGGYERCAGDVLPSETNVLFLELESVSGAISIGDVFTSGDTSISALEVLSSPENGDVIAFATHETSIPDSTSFTGDSVNLTVTAVVTDLSDYDINDIYEFRDQAFELTRDNVPEIPGSGSVDGGFRLRGKNYVFRGGKLYEGSGNEWTLVEMPDILYFDEGTVEFNVGETITDGTATATIVSITRQEGAWDSGVDAEDQSLGYLTLSGVTGTFTDNATITGGAGGAAVADGANYTYSLSYGGRYATSQPYNFTNIESNESVFGADGVNDAFEFDGTSYIPIFDPNADTEKPKFVKIHQNRLQLFYPGGVFEYSVSGQPRVFNSLLGAGSYATGSEIVGAHVIHGNAEAVFCENSTWLLLGDGIYDDETATRNWTFYEHDSNVGATQWSIAERGNAYFVSNGEVRFLQATDTTSGYSSTPVFTNFQSEISSNCENISCSIWCREKGQYRIFYADDNIYSGGASFLTISGDSQIGGMSISYGKQVRNCWSAVESGVEKMFFTSDDGYLYRMDSGNSFDGSEITGSFRTPFYNYGSPGVEKMFQNMVIEFDAPVSITGNTTFTYTVNYDYGSIDAPTPSPQTSSDVQQPGGVYGSNAGYGGFVYGGPIVSQIYAEIDGYGENMSMLITFSTKNDSSFRFRNNTVDYINIGRKRK